jgi:CheY-like chemotaxis protein
MPAGKRPSVLCVDDDRDIAEVVQAVLSDEGYKVSCLYSSEDGALARLVGRLEPDCVLLDGLDPSGNQHTWLEAASLAHRRRQVPVIMLTTDPIEAAEARKGTSSRAQAADFAAVIEKPFSLDELLEAVAAATGRSIPFDRSRKAEAERTRRLVNALREQGATQIAASQLREWATFRDRRSALWQIYWWQLRGVYQLGRYDTEGRMGMFGQFTDRDVAIAAALPE